MSIVKLIKHNSLSRASFEALLRFRCRRTRYFVFVANPGRSGSMTLADLLFGIPDLAVFHEPTPKLAFEPSWGLDQSSELRATFARKKIFYILQAAAGKSHYIETNHLFIKTFAESAIQYFGDRIKIIHLQRDPVSVAMSYYRLGVVAGHGEVAFRYLLDPAHPDNIISGSFLTEPKSPQAHDFYRNLWYWYEVEARIASTRAKYPNAGWVDLHTDELNDRGAVRRLCGELGIERGVEQILDRVGLRANARAAEKDTLAAEYSQLGVAEADEMNRLLREELRRRGHAVPECGRPMQR